MLRIVTALTAIALLAGCGGSDSSVLRTDDVIQFRQLLDDDPLAMKAEMPDGTPVVVGDLLLSDRGIHRTAVMENSEGRFDIQLTLIEREYVNMKNYWSGRRSSRQVVVFRNGEAWRIVDGDVLRKDNKMLLENVAEDEAEATRFADRIVMWKQKDKE